MIKIDMDTLIIDTDELSFNALRPELEKGLNVVLADHAKQAAGGKAPDGSSQKENSEPYRTIKRTKGVKVGSRRLRGTVPTILSGDMMGSRLVKSTANEIRAIFTGRDNAAKASSLTKKGYRIHFFSKKNMDYLAKRTSEAIRLDKLIKVKK